MNSSRPRRGILALLRGFRNLLGVGIHLLSIGLLLEASAIIFQQWVSFPVSLSVGTQIAFSLPCVLFGLVGAIWFNRTLNLARVHLLGGDNKLITHGPYNYVRHPLYTSLMISLPPLTIIWYADLLFIVPWILIFVVAHHVVLLEERNLVKTFGDEYIRYRDHVPPLLPTKGNGGRRFRDRQDGDSSVKSDTGTM